MLCEAGLDQSFIREHSPEWVMWAHERLDRRYRLREANRAELMALAFGASQSEEGLGSFQEALQTVRGADDQDVAYLMDPNAQFDEVAARSTGMYVSGPKEKTDAP